MPKRKASPSSFGQVKRKIIEYQQGYGNIPVFRTYPLQKGYGLGGLFRGLFRKAAPILKKGLVKATKQALKSGANVFEDVVENQTPFKQAVKKEAKSGFQNFKKQFDGSQNVINRGSKKSKSITLAKKRKQTRPRKRTKGGFQKITL